MVYDFPWLLCVGKRRERLGRCTRWRYIVSIVDGCYVCVIACCVKGMVSPLVCSQYCRGLDTRGTLTVSDDITLPWSQMESSIAKLNSPHLITCSYN